MNAPSRASGGRIHVCKQAYVSMHSGGHDADERRLNESVSMEKVIWHHRTRSRSERARTCGRAVGSEGSGGARRGGGLGLVRGGAGEKCSSEI
jgi:hypothetical protein